MDGQTDRQVDVGHINLIGGLVTCNPPKTMSCVSTGKTVHSVHLLGGVPYFLLV